MQEDKETRTELAEAKQQVSGMWHKRDCTLRRLNAQRSAGTTAGSAINKLAYAA